VKYVSLTLSAVSLAVSLGLAYAAWTTYQKVEDLINNPEKLVEKVVKGKVEQAIPSLPLPIKLF